MDKISVSVNKNFWDSKKIGNNATIDKYGHIHFTMKKKNKKGCNNK